MTIANKITVGRILLIPLMIIFVLIQSLNRPTELIIFDMTIGQLIFQFYLLLLLQQIFLMDI